MSESLRGNVLTTNGWKDASIQFGERIAAIDGTDVDPEQNDFGYIIPGFIDLHVHGAGGKDTMEAGDAVDVIARKHAQHGTTSLLATTMTAPQEDLERALAAIRDIAQQRPEGRARVLGVHLEGPYINPGKLGAQPPFAAVATMEQVMHLNAIAPIKLITVAPEMDGHLELVKQLTDAGMVVQLAIR